MAVHPPGIKDVGQAHRVIDRRQINATIMLTHQNMTVIFQIMPDFKNCRILEQRLQDRHGIIERNLVRHPGIGIEVEGSVFPTDGLDVFANVSLSQVLERDTRTGDTIPDASSSSVKLNSGVAWRSPYRTDLSLSTHYLSPQTWRLRGFDDQGATTILERDVPSRFFLNARVAVRPFADEQLELAVTGWNLLQLAGPGFVEHPEGQPVRGRAYGSATYRF